MSSSDPKWLRASRPGWRVFQRRNSLVADGIPGLATLTRVRELEGLVAEDITRKVAVVPKVRNTAGGRRIDKIVLHHNGVPGRDVDDIRNWHVKGKGWSDVGYHRIYLDGERAGEMQDGRPFRRPGAHAKDFNDHTLGYCLIGNGDDDVFDVKQLAKLREDLVVDLEFYGLDPADVIGHREVNQLLGPNDHKTLKNCPGKFFDLDSFRATLAPTTA